MSGHQYNLINELAQMEAMGVDIARVSADSDAAIDQIGCFKRQLDAPNRIALENAQCNGYWHRIAGMDTSIGTK